MNEYPAIHPIAAEFPPMSARELRMLEMDITDHGIRQPLTLWQEKVVDGRHRLQIARKLGLPPDEIPVVRLPADMTLDEVSASVRSRNLVSRHLSAGQRAILAARLPRLAHGGDRRSGASDPPGAWTQPNEARRARAAAYGVSVSQLRRADFVTTFGSPELVNAVFSGRVSLSRADLVCRGEQEPEPPRGRPWLVQAGARLDDAIGDFAAALAAGEGAPADTAAAVDGWIARLARLRDGGGETAAEAAPTPVSAPSA